MAQTTRDTLVTFLEEGVPALLAEGEVYLSDAFRDLQAAPPKISVGVSVQGSVLDLEVDTGEFPVSELKALLKSLHQKKRYHRLRDGRLLRLDDSLEVLDELNETLELSGAKLGQNHAQLPLYRAPSLDWALSGQTGVRFNRDDAFRRISRSFHAVKDSEYAPPASLQKTLRKYQRDGYRWLRTLDGYGMGGILADDMGLGKTVQVLSYLLAMKQNGQTLPSLIVCPASLVLNWAEECQKFTPELSCVVVDGDAAHRAELAESWPAADLVVTSYDLLRRDEALYEGQEFYACILDEAQAIKNHTTQKYKAVCKVRSRVRFALTGTPVENRLGELWSIFSFLMPGYLPPYKSFCSRFEKPIVQEEDQTAVRRLNQLTGPFILRRMKSDVLKELPPRPRMSTASSWKRSSASSIWPLWWTPGRSCRPQSPRTRWRCSPSSCGCGRSAATRALSQTTGRVAAPSWTPAWSLSPAPWRAATASCCSASSPRCSSCWQSVWTPRASATLRCRARRRSPSGRSWSGGSTGER